MCKDELFKELFKVTKAAEEEILEMNKAQQGVNVFKEF